MLPLCNSVIPPLAISCYSFTYCNLHLLPLTSKLNRVHHLLLNKICAKVDKINWTVWSLLCAQGISTFVYCDLDLWPLTSNINRIDPHIYAKFNQNTLNALISIVLTRLYLLLSIVTLTFDLQISTGFILLSWLTCLPILMKMCTTVKSEPQQRYYIPSATRCAGIIIIAENLSLQ